MRHYELRPMSVGEVIDGAVAIYRSRFSVLVAIAIVTQGVPALLNVSSGLQGGVGGNASLALLAILLGLVGGLLAAAASVWVVSEAYLGREATLWDSLEYALGKVWALLVAGIIKYFLITIGTVFFIIPGIFVAAALSVVSQVVVLEGKGGARSVGRSWDLTKGHRGKAFLLGVVVLFLFYLPVMAASFLAVAVPSLRAVLGVAGQLIGLLVYPIVVCTFTLYYYDLRVRKEAFDLELLNRELTGEYEVPA